MALSSVTLTCVAQRSGRLGPNSSSWNTGHRLALSSAWHQKMPWGGKGKGSKGRPHTHRGFGTARNERHLGKKNNSSFRVASPGASSTSAPTRRAEDEQQVEPPAGTDTSRLQLNAHRDLGAWAMEKTPGRISFGERHEHSTSKCR